MGGFVTGVIVRHRPLRHAAAGGKLRGRGTKQAPLDTVDRDLSLRLNRERRVAFSLPAP